MSSVKDVPNDFRAPPKSYRININGFGFKVIGGMMYGTTDFYIHLVQALDPMEVDPARMGDLVAAIYDALYQEHGITGNGLKHSMIDLLAIAV